MGKTKDVRAAVEAAWMALGAVEIRDELQVTS
jgi:hypothetical protein